MITIIDYGLSNLRSVQKAFYRIGIDTNISNQKNIIDNATKLILPGVGHFAVGMQRLRELDLIEVLNKKVLAEKIPILGICLGMQLMTLKSEEGGCKGLGWIDAETRKFLLNGKWKVPHMGWNSLIKLGNQSILKNFLEDNSFYFVHSFFVKCNCKEDILSTTYYGLEFHSGFQVQNIMGVQFHPEKSHDQGLELLKAFAII